MLYYSGPAPGYERASTTAESSGNSPKLNSKLEAIN